MIALLLSLLSLLAHPAPGQAPEAKVLLVLSSDAEPYQVVAGIIEERLPDLAFERALLSELKIDSLAASAAGSPRAVMAIGSLAAGRLGKELSEGLPLLYCMVGDPEALGLAERSSCWGVTTAVPPAKQIGLIRRALPRTRRVGLLYRSGNRPSQRTATLVRQALPEGWELTAVDVDACKTFDEASDRLFDDRVDLLWASPDASVFDRSTLRHVLLGALRREVPVLGFSATLVRSGALLGVGVDPADQGRQAAALLDQFHRAPQHLTRVVAPDFYVALNLVVAERLDIDLPDSLVREARYVTQR